jgi:hypothetical protein
MRLPGATVTGKHTGARMNVTTEYSKETSLTFKSTIKGGVKIPFTEVGMEAAIEAATKYSLKEGLTVYYTLLQVDGEMKWKEEQITRYRLVCSGYEDVPALVWKSCIGGPDKVMRPAMRRYWEQTVFEKEAKRETREQTKKGLFWLLKRDKIENEPVD